MANIASVSVPGPSAKPGLFRAVADAWRQATGKTALRSTVNDATTARIPYPLKSKPLPPAVHELSRLLDKHDARLSCRHLHIVEQTLVMQHGSFEMIPDGLLHGAHHQLQMLARRATLSPALARLLDLFERELINVDIRRFCKGGAQARTAVQGSPNAG